MARDLQCMRGSVPLELPHQRNPSHLPGSAPDTLEEAILLGQAVEAVVALAHGANEAAQGVGLVLAYPLLVL